MGYAVNGPGCDNRDFVVRGTERLPSIGHEIRLDGIAAVHHAHSSQSLVALIGFQTEFQAMTMTTIATTATRTTVNDDDNHKYTNIEQDKKKKRRIPLQK